MDLDPPVDQNVPARVGIGQLTSNKNTKGETMRQRISVLLFVLFSAASPSAAQKDDFPHLPIKIVVGFAPGGATDTVARILSSTLASELGQSIFIENISGASGLLGWKAVAASNPDGHSLLMAENALAIRPGFKDQMPLFDPIVQLDAIALVAHSPLALCVSKRVPVNSVQELIAFSHGSTNKLDYASAGAGSVAQLVWEVVREGADIDAVNVPFRGGGPAMADLVAGREDIIMASSPVAKPYVDSNMIKALAVTGRDRSPAFPQVPTLAEAGITHRDVDLRFWFGVFAPKGLPDPVKAKLQTAIEHALADHSVRERLAALDITPDFAPAPVMQAFLQTEIKNWRSFIEARGLTSQ
jgi:tripartite-type tricarboxylate transporter receptor subunit TctC